MRAAGSLLAFAIALVLAACSGGSSGGEVPGVISAIAARDEVDDAPQTSSTIEVTFDRELEFPRSRIPLASNFELKVPTFSQDGDKVTTHLVKTAELKEGSTRVIVVTVATVVTEGTKLEIKEQAFKPDSRGTLEVEVEAEFDPLIALLATDALWPQDPDVLSGANPPVATEGDRDPVAMRDRLVAHLEQRGATEEDATNALATYDSMPDTIVQSPKARAALAALTGTFAEGAISSLLTNDNCTERPAARIAFEEPPDFPSLFARVTYSRNGARIVSLNPNIEGERLEHLMPILAHEAIHCDRSSGRFEEIAATALDTFLYIQLLAAMPDLATADTPLARELNIDAIALINSGRQVPESIGILPSPGVTRVIPGTTDANRSFADLVASAYETIEYNESPDERLAQTYVANIAAANGFPESSAFNLLYLDELLGRSVTGEELVGAITALQLGPED